MAKMAQVLVLEPAIELKFKGPFKDVVTSNLKLTNPTDKKVCFKVKTTAPRRYCVRPNSGIVDSHSTMTIAVMLQPTELLRPEKFKHKFMVQSLFAPEGEFNLDLYFKEADQSQFMDSKLRCVFELPDEDQEEMFNTQEVVPPVQTSVEPPKPLTQHASVDSELKKAGEEIRQLRAETSCIRQENLQLKVR